MDKQQYLSYTNWILVTWEEPVRSRCSVRETKHKSERGTIGAEEWKIEGGLGRVTSNIAPFIILLCFGKYESPVQTVMIIDDSLNFRSLLLTIIFAFKQFTIVGNERGGTKGLSHFTC